MQNKLKIAIKITTLSVVFLFLVLGLYAKNRYHNLLAFQNTSKAKPLLITKSVNNVIYAHADKGGLVDKKQESKESIFVIKPDRETRQQRHFEEWMYDEYFWQIKIPEWDQEPFEDPYELEDWMFNVELKLAGCIDIYSDFKEQKWMRSHSFLIL